VTNEQSVTEGFKIEADASKGKADLVGYNKC